MKIAVIGYSGAGKSTLAKALGERYGAEVLYLDQVHWLPGWRERPADEEEKLVKAFMDSRSEWVIDGNYFRLEGERRFEEADKIVFMNFHRLSCLLRARRRYLSYRGKTRESMTDGCAEKMDAEFVRWILWDSRKRARRKKFKDLLFRYPEKTAVIKNQRQLEKLIKNGF